MIKTWLIQIRANFLALAVILVMIGGAASYHEGIFDIIRFLLTMVGIVLAHISVNLFNEYSDWRSGIDDMTDRTPFSGGTGTLQEGKLPPGQVRFASWLTLIIAFFIGCYLAWVSGWPVLAFMAIGGLSTVFYTDYLTKWMLGEVTSGIALGSLVVIGAYYVQTVTVSPSIVWASVPPGLLTMELLFLNEFPDVDADRHGGRLNMVIALGKKRAAIGYAVIIAAVYVSLALSVLTGNAPWTLLIGLLTLPLAIMAVYRAIRYPDNRERFMPALGMNVIVVLATDALMALGYVLG